MKILILLLPAILVSACDGDYNNSDTNPLHLPPQGFVGNSAEVKLFQQNCVSCHGVNAQGTVEWKKADSTGNYPPPPLNGTAHAWHHDFAVLKRTIREGGVKQGGTMPPFKDKLSEHDIDSVIAYFQSKWSNKRYQDWRSRVQNIELPVIGLAQH